MNKDFIALIIAFLLACGSTTYLKSTRADHHYENWTVREIFWDTFWTGVTLFFAVLGVLVIYLSLIK